jgi:hypothetical protein
MLAIHVVDIEGNTFRGEKLQDCMAEDAVASELFSALFPANREKYRDFGPFVRPLL